MIILGINLFHANSSATLVKDGKIIYSIEEERFKRIKNYSGFPLETIEKLLKNSNISIKHIDYVATNKSSFYNLYEKVKFNLFNFNYSNLVSIIKRSYFKNNYILQELSKFGELKNLKKIVNIPHHLSHISYSYFLSRFENAFGLTVDGSGDFSTSESYKINSGNINLIDKILFPNSLGIFYQAFTQFLGFRRYGDEFKVMALASYGKPKYIKEINKIIMVDDNFNFKLNLKFFKHQKIGFNLFNHSGYPVFTDLFTSEIEKELNISSRYKNEKLLDKHADIAASVQSVFEKTIFGKINYLQNKTKINKACFAGGCFFNSKMAGKIKYNTGLKEIYIGPNPGDAGGSAGSALYLSNKLKKINPNHYYSEKISYSFDYKISDEEKIFIKFKDSVKIKKFANDAELIHSASESLKSKKIICWFQSSSEWGPRALGRRSILANPSSKSIADEINIALKKRESFRPFAPSICADDYSKYFEDNFDCSFMNYVVKVKKNAEDKIPAVVHIDGTSRAHSVLKKDNEIFYKLIKLFKKKTGIACILNTSFNVDEPICETIEDAINTFLKSNLEFLYVNKNLITKKN
jgi:carbamoyltransferase